jgi:hypothetical protein
MPPRRFESRPIRTESDVVAVRQLARRLGGDVAVRSVEREGSVFTVRVPLKSRAEPPGSG